MKSKTSREKSGRSVKYLAIVLSVVLVPLTSVPVLAQTTPTGDQYPTEDQYHPGGSGGLGDDVAVSALRTLRALSDPPANDAELGATSAENTASSAVTKYGLTELPDTGGISLLWLGALLVAGGVLARKITR